MKKAFANISDGNMFYLTEGSGEAIMLLHMTPSSSEQYLGVIPYLSANYWVIAVDTLGYGLSDDPPRYYEVSDYANSMISLLDVLGIGKTNLVGHHTGSSIAAEIAAAYPERVNKLVLSACPILNQVDWPDFIKQSKMPPTFGKPLVIPDDDGSFLMERWKQSKGSTPQMEPRSRLQSITSRVLTESRPYHIFAALMKYDIKDRLPLIKSPTLLTSGVNDSLCAQLETAQRLVPRYRTVVISDTGAGVTREKPQEFAAIILEFLNNPGV
jgi:pimeloyl-ACP methyl ester carboxylesterase